MTAISSSGRPGLAEQSSGGVSEVVQPEVPEAERLSLHLDGAKCVAATGRASRAGHEYEPVVRGCARSLGGPAGHGGHEAPRRAVRASATTPSEAAVLSADERATVATELLGDGDLAVARSRGRPTSARAPREIRSPAKRTGRRDRPELVPEGVEQRGRGLLAAEVDRLASAAAPEGRSPSSERTGLTWTCPRWTREAEQRRGRRDGPSDRGAGESGEPHAGR